jgi:hypothetical protein
VLHTINFYQIEELKATLDCLVFKRNYRNRLSTRAMETIENCCSDGVKCSEENIK